ncbi:MAG: LexA family protein [Bacteriovoracia bacterium]
MSEPYEVTGFQSACAEFAEKPLSLDERYLTNRPSLFIIEAAGESKVLGISKGDKLLIDRSLGPKEGQLCLFVINNQFQLQKFSSRMLQGQDPETGDFVWGVVTTLLREFNRSHA